MGLRGRSQITNPTLFFTTFTTLNRQQILDDENKLSQAKERLLNVCHSKDIKLFAYVTMTNHIHLIVYCPEGGMQLSKLVSSVKGLIRKDIVGNFRMWEREIDDKIIISAQMLNGYVEYIHFNPVKAGLVETTVEYPFSSARVWQGLEQDSRVSMHFANLF